MLIARRYDAHRTRHAYYWQVRLIHEHFGCEAANLTEAEMRECCRFVEPIDERKP